LATPAVSDRLRRSEGDAEAEARRKIVEIRPIIVWMVVIVVIRIVWPVEIWPVKPWTIIKAPKIDLLDAVLLDLLERSPCHSREG
jgi:hypothetical protein